MMRLLKKLSPTQIIMISFLLAILIGSGLLALPVSSVSPAGVPYIDALFTAVTSVCVTGLVTVPTVTTWSIFGQIVILLLIQAGGLGIVTVISAFIIRLNRRIGIGAKMLLQDAFNLNTMANLITFVKNVLVGTFIVEGAGALLYMTVFVPEFGLRGIWVSIFNSVSAFCNAGIDIISENSLCSYVTNPMVNITTCILVILGGLGYIVWWDIIRVIHNARARGARCLRHLTLHSKVAVCMTLILILAGTAVFFAFEYNNELTIKNYSLPEKLLASFFQSVTTRTAGFATIPQQNFTNSSSVVALILMFIGGSPVGTAGGVKTVTVAVLVVSAFATVKGKRQVVIFNRTIPKQAVSKSVAVICISFMIMFLSTLFLSIITDADFLDILYETASATATVGLSRDLTSSLNVWGRIIIIITMYLGRVGPISLFIALNRNNAPKSNIKEPTEQIQIG